MDTLEKIKIGKNMLELEVTTEVLADTEKVYMIPDLEVIVTVKSAEIIISGSRSNITKVLNKSYINEDGLGELMALAFSTQVITDDTTTLTENICITDFDFKEGSSLITLKTTENYLFHITKVDNMNIEDITWYAKETDEDADLEAY